MSDQLYNWSEEDTLKLYRSCIPQGLRHYEGNIDTLECIYKNPLFVNPLTRDYRLTGESPCADMGTNDSIGEEFDIRGTDFFRKLDKASGEAGIVDIGAYEYQPAMDPYQVFILKYTTDPQGILEGEYLQYVLPGENGTPVVVAPNNSRFEFAGWSDGVTDNPRVDLDVQEHIEAHAIFSEIRSLHTENEPRISVYPVPFNDYLIITGGKINNEMEVSLYGIDGRLYYRYVLTGGRNQINTTALNKGTYILKINSEKLSYSMRVVKR